VHQRPTLRKKTKVQAQTTSTAGILNCTHMVISADCAPLDLKTWPLLQLCQPVTKLSDCRSDFSKPDQLLKCRSFYILHRGALTHKRVYTEKLLHRGACTHRSFYAEKSLHRGAFKHRRFYTEKLLRREVLHRGVYTQKLFTHRRFYTQKLLHREVFTQRGFYTQKLLHREEVLHTDPFAHRSLYTRTRSSAQAFTH